MTRLAEAVEVARQVTPLDILSKDKMHVPEDESVATLFTDLGVTNLLTGIPIGGYGLDWGHTTPASLERDILFQATVAKKAEDKERWTTLYRTPSSRTYPEPDSSYMLPTFGPPEQPILDLMEGKKVIDGGQITILAVRYFEGRMQLRLVLGNSPTPQESVITVAEFRTFLAKAAESGLRFKARDTRPEIAKDAELPFENLLGKYVEKHSNMRPGQLKSVLGRRVPLGKSYVKDLRSSKNTEKLLELAMALELSAVEAKVLFEKSGVDANVVSVALREYERFTKQGRFSPSFL